MDFTDEQQKKFEKLELSSEQKKALGDLFAAIFADFEQTQIAAIERIAWAVFANTMIAPSAALAGAYNVLVEIASITEPAAAELVTHVRAVLTRAPPYRGSPNDAVPSQCVQQFIRLATAGEGDAFCAAQMLCATLAGVAPSTDPAMLARRGAVPADVRAKAAAIVNAFTA